MFLAKNNFLSLIDILAMKNKSNKTLEILSKILGGIFVWNAATMVGGKNKDFQR